MSRFDRIQSLMRTPLDRLETQGRKLVDELKSRPQLDEARTRLETLLARISDEVREPLKGEEGLTFDAVRRAATAAGEALGAALRGQVEEAEQAEAAGEATPEAEATGEADAAANSGVEPAAAANSDVEPAADTEEPSVEAEAQAAEVSAAEASAAAASEAEVIEAAEPKPKPKRRRRRKAAE